MNGLQFQDLKNSEGRYIVFTIAGRSYATPLLSVQEVIGISEITPVPKSPPHFRGIMNLRGKIISIIDLRAKLQLDGLPVPKSDRVIIVFDIEGICLGILVDSVDQVLAVKPENFNSKPQAISGVSMEYISGIISKEKDLILVLDIENILGIEDRKIAEQAISAAR